MVFHADQLHSKGGRKARDEAWETRIMAGTKAVQDSAEASVAQSTIPPRKVPAVPAETPDNSIEVPVVYSSLVRQELLESSGDETATSTVRRSSLVRQQPILT